MQAAHAKLGGSNAERWIECPASVSAEASIPDSPESDAAVEGTMAHTCIDLKLSFPNEGDELVKAFVGEKFVQQHAWAYEQALDFVTVEKALSPPGTVVVPEQRFNMSKVLGVPDQFGTGDITIYKPGEFLHIADYKHGKGKYVHHVKNYQLIYYALGALEHFKLAFDEIRMTIIQPRVGGEVVRTWSQTRKEMDEWRKFFHAKAQDTVKPNPKFKAGAHCFFCKFKTECKEFRKGSTDHRGAFDPVEEPSRLPAVVKGKTPSPKDLGYRLAVAEKLEAWARAVKEQAFDVMKSGGKVEGYKLVFGRGRRDWRDQRATARQAEKLFGDNAFSPRELLSPAQLERVAGKAWVAERVFTAGGGLTMAPAEDPRPDAREIITCGFDEPFERREDSKMAKATKKAVAKKKTAKKAAPKKTAKKAAAKK